MGKILYIYSDLRSGSTLLDSLLASEAKNTSVGELLLLQNYYNRKGGGGEVFNWKCSCDRIIQECEFWNRVIHNADPTKTSVTIIRKVYKNILLLFFPSLFIRKLINPYNRKTIENLDNIYDNVFRYTGSEIIIDSSKKPEQGYLLSHFSKHEIINVRIRRDLRAIYHSKKKYDKNKDNLTRFKFMFMTLLFDRKIDIFFKRSKGQKKGEIYYEDLARDPIIYLNKLCKELHIRRINVPEYIDYDGKHVIAGTPNRLKGRTKIKLDEKWKVSHDIYSILLGILKK